jgi:hypothetical protein
MFCCEDDSLQEHGQRALENPLSIRMQASVHVMESFLKVYGAYDLQIDL